jgi:tetratricopeptide (TPR) repeat protein
MPVSSLALALALGTEDPRADNVHYRDAELAFAEGRWEDALAALDRAHEVDPRPEYLFMQAQVLRTHERCPEAIEKYREFLATAPPREDVLSAQAGLQLCGVEEPAPAPPPVDPPVDDAPPPPPPKEPTRRVSSTAVTHALVWPGLAVAGVGTGLLVAAHTRMARAREEPTEPEFEETARASPAMSQAGIALVSIGGAVLAAGIVHAIVVATRKKRDRHHARVAFTPFVVRW